nr:succinylglutamate desuccinylase/aspartoacylase family protein [Aquitalea sp. ASV11]
MPNINSIAIHQFASLGAGPKLIVLGAVHGNEVCGTQAIRRLIREIESGAVCIHRGSLTLVPVTNPLAYQFKRRHGDRNLNRNMRLTHTPQDYEDHVANMLCPLLQAHDVLLDLHSFHAPGRPFALIGSRNNVGDLETVGKADAEEAIALRLGVDRFVEGWLETYAKGVEERQQRGVDACVDYGVGTTETMRRSGGIAVTLECGQHDEGAAPEVAYQAILNTLAHLGMVHQVAPAAAMQPETIRLYQVVDRLHPEDRFSKDWCSFDIIKRGEPIACRHDGSTVLADRDGWIVFPNPAALVNQEWFYLAEASDRLSSDSED